MTKVLEFEGTAEEIQLRFADFAGQRMYVTAYSVEAPLADSASPADKMSTVQKIIARAKLTPKHESDKIPADFCDQLDHYIYGTPKK